MNAKTKRYIFDGKEDNYLTRKKGRSSKTLTLYIKTKNIGDAKYANTKSTLQLFLMLYLTIYKIFFYI